MNEKNNRIKWAAQAATLALTHLLDRSISIEDAYDDVVVGFKERKHERQKAQDGLPSGWRPGAHELEEEHGLNAPKVGSRAKPNLFPTSRIVDVVRERSGIKRNELARLIIESTGITSVSTYQKLRSAEAQKAIHIDPTTNVVTVRKES
jgi:hypothetical protein